MRVRDAQRVWLVVLLSVLATFVLGLVLFFVLAMRADNSMPTSSASPNLTVLSPTPPSASLPTTIPQTPNSGKTIDLNVLTIDDRPSLQGYRRELFPTWLDTDGNGCNARDYILSKQSVEPVQKAGGCQVVAGKWISIYDDVIVDSPASVDIDHLVPLANAWQSGAKYWDAARRAKYANDTIDKDHLLAVTFQSNRQKGDSAPDKWRPNNKDVSCRYATAWINVKTKWNLSATTSERDALGQMLETCK